MESTGGSWLSDPSPYRYRLLGFASQFTRSSPAEAGRRACRRRHPDMRDMFSQVQAATVVAWRQGGTPWPGSRKLRSIQNSPSLDLRFSAVRLSEPIASLASLPRSSFDQSLYGSLRVRHPVRNASRNCRRQSVESYSAYSISPSVETMVPTCQREIIRLNGGMAAVFPEPNLP